MAKVFIYTVDDLRRLYSLKNGVTSFCIVVPSQECQHLLQPILFVPVSLQLWMTAQQGSSKRPCDFRPTEKQQN